MSNSIGIVAPGSTRSQIIIYSKQNFKTDYLAINGTNAEKTNSKALFEICAVETINERLENLEYFRLMMPDDDYSKYTIYKAEAKFIGVLSDNDSTGPSPSFYVSAPGTKLYEADLDDIKKIIGIDEKKGRIKIGCLLKDTRVSVFLDFNSLFLTHCSILGRTGSGKTYFITHLLKSINKKYMVISSTGEYDSLGDDSCLVNPKSMALNIYRIREVLDLNYSENNYLEEFIRSNQNVDSNITSRELARMIADFFTQDGTPLKKQMSLFSEELMGKKKELPKYIQSLCDKLSRIYISVSWHGNKIGYPCILDTQELSPQIEQITIYSILTDLLEIQKRSYIDLQKDNSTRQIEDILIILEEAHNYAPSTKTSICKNIIIKIAREGRKYGLHLIVLSQRPRYIDQTLLSQCGTNIIFNLPNPIDIEYITNHSNFNNRSNLDVIQNLKTGSCLITSNARESDIICKIAF